MPNITQSIRYQKSIKKKQTKVELVMISPNEMFSKAKIAGDNLTNFRRASEGKTYSIQYLEKIIGINKHTIRIWESRYKLFEPVRDRNNARSYSVTHIEKALKISLLKRNGHKISRLALMSDDELKYACKVLMDQEVVMEKAVNQLLLSLVKSELDDFEDHLNTYLRIWPHNIAFPQIVYPFLQKTGLLFNEGNTIEECMISSMIRRKYLCGIELGSSVIDTREKAFLFVVGKAPPSLLLLHATFLLKLAGYNVLYLDVGIREAVLLEMIGQYQPKYLFGFGTLKAMEGIQFSDAVLRSQFLKKVFLIQPDANKNEPSGIRNHINVYYSHVSTFLEQLTYYCS